MFKYTKIISSILMLLITFSTTGIVINEHICSGNVKNISAFFKVEQCEHSEQTKIITTHCHLKKNTEKKDCCKNGTKEFKNKEHTLNYNKISIDQLSIINYVLVVIFTPDEITSEYSIHTYDKPPPELSMRYSLHKVNQQYLI